MARRTLLIGGGGQVGGELIRTLAPLGELVVTGRIDLDLTRPDAIRSKIAEVSPDVIVNAAAYTAVDAAEQASDEAHAINATAVSVMAEAAARSGALFIHYSTDYVFDGTAHAPYREDSPTGPIGAYGRSKLAGDEAVLASGADGYILRVAWVYGMRGKNFLTTMRRLAGERDELRVVADQIGGPTWSRMIAEATHDVVAWLLADRAADRESPAPGLYHLAPPDHTSWHAFAEAIVAGLPKPPRVVPITTAEYPTPAKRPAWSVLDSGLLQERFGVVLPSWREQLRRCLESAES